MEIIYVDRLFLVNFIIDYFLLLITGRVCGMRLRRGYIALGAALGGVYAVAVLYPGLGFLSALPIKFCCAGAMMLTAYWGEQHLFRGMAAFALLSAAFGGVAWAASMSLGFDVRTGLYIPVSFKVLALSFGVCYGGILFLLNRRGQRMEREKQRLMVLLADRRVELQALVDTGNTLYDPISGRKILVVEAKALSPLFDENIAEVFCRSDTLEAFQELSHQQELAGRLGLVPFSALGTKSGLLLTIRPDSVQQGTQKLDVLVGAAPQTFCADGEYNAIL
jgi:stage II sporulation protein GA (sporulation sigma-E factor processing peptidase)